MRLAVVGSGPCGTAAASVLVERGHEVDMLDVGHEMEPAARALEARLASGTAREGDLEMLRHGLDGPPPRSGLVAALRALADIALPAASARLNWKRVLGSLFPYRDVDTWIPLSESSPPILRSLSRGGLSNVWGAACYPFTAEDLATWPIPFGELERFYPEAARRLDLVEAPDPLEEIYPVYRSRSPLLSLSPGSESLLSRWTANREVLREAGISFGRARLAVLPEDSDDRAGCRYTGLCFYGCPHRSIWSARYALDALERNPNFRYRPGLAVRRFSESPDGRGVSIEAQVLATSEPLRVDVDRLFLGAGTLSSFRIVADSMGARRPTRALLDNDMFLLPVLRTAEDAALPATELGFGLSELVLVLDATSHPRHALHAQIYPRTAALEERTSAVLSLVPRPIARRIARLLERLHVLVLYLPSELSREIKIQALRSRDSSVATLELRARSRGWGSRALAAALRLLHRNREALGFYPLVAGLKRTGPGFSGHLAGSLPAARDPGVFATYPDGRLAGTRSVYAVDMSVFPTLPAQNPTYSAMANALRIATRFADECGRETPPGRIP